MSRKTAARPTAASAPARPASGPPIVRTAVSCSAMRPSSQALRRRWVWGLELLQLQQGRRPASPELRLLFWLS